MTPGSRSRVRARWDSMVKVPPPPPLFPCLLSMALAGAAVPGTARPRRRGAQPLPRALKAVASKADEFPPRATVQEENSTEMNVAVSHGKKSQVGADVGRFGHVGTTTKRNDEIEVGPSPNPNPNPQLNPQPSPHPHAHPHPNPITTPEPGIHPKVEGRQPEVQLRQRELPKVRARVHRVAHGRVL